MIKKEKILIIITIALSIFCIGSGIYVILFNSSFKQNNITIQYSDKSNLQSIANPVLEKYLQKYNSKMYSYTFKSSQLIAGDNKTFAVSTIFDVEPSKSNIDYLIKGDTKGSDGTIHCAWTLILRNTSENNYQLLDVLQTKDVTSKLNLKNNDELVKPKEVSNDKSTYKIEGNKLYLTYDGATWIKAPIDAKSLISNDNSNQETDNSGQETKNKLPDGSYYISPSKTAFIYGNGNIALSSDAGNKWTTIKLPNDINNITKQFIGFVGKDFSYAVITGDKAMSFEMANIYTSNDGGNTFEFKGPLKKDGTFIITGVSFSNDKIGFITTEGNTIYMTKDSGTTWDTIKLPMPENLKGIYDTPKAPTFKGKHGEFYVSQGNDGDYGAGENQMCKFVSDDYGLTWQYKGEVVQ